MASKDEINFGEGDLDDLDFGDLNFDLSDDPFAEAKDNRKPIEHFKEAVKQSAKNKLTDTGFLRRVLSKALPKGYVQAMGAYDALDQGIEQIMKDNQAELNPYLIGMKRKFDMMNPNLRRLVPRSIREAADMASDKSESSSSVGGKDELTMNIEGLDGLFKAQADDRIRGEFRDAVKDTREQKRFKAQMSVDMATAKGIGRLVGYQDNILINYHRKHLELSYRQLDVNVRMLKASSEFYHEAGGLLKAIGKNTGLPDFVKMRTTEVVEQQMKQKLAQAAFGGAAGYAKKLFNGISQNASEMLGQGLEFHSQLKSAEDFGRTKAQMAGSILGTLAGDQLGEWGEEALGRGAEMAKPLLERFGFIRKTDNFLRRNLTGIPQRINEWAKSDTDYDSKTGLAQAGLKALLDTHSTSTSISGRSIDELDKPAMFDDLFHKTVTEILPAQLASIDRWVKTIATGEDQEETAWSHYTGSLVKRSTLNQQHLKIALKGAGSSLRYTVDSILTEMNANELTPEARRALRVRLMRDLSDANDFKPERYVKEEAWSKTDPSVAKEIIDFFADKFALDKETGQHSRDETQTGFYNDVRDKFIGAQSGLADIPTRMDIMSKVVGRRAWREMGLTDWNGQDGDSIRLDDLFDQLINEGEEKDLTKKDEVKLSAKERAKKRFEEEQKKKREAEGIHDVEDDRNLRGKFGPRGNPAAGPQPYVWSPGMSPPPAPAPVTVKVTAPEMYKTADEETHKRLDALIALATTLTDGNGKLNENTFLGVEYLDLIASLLQQQGQGGEGEGEGGPAPTPGLGGSRRITLGGILGWSARNGAKAVKGAAKGFAAYTKFAYSTIFKGLNLGRKAAWGAAKFPFKRLDGFGVSDIHVMGDPEPSLLAKGIRNGWYFDVNSKKVIQSIDDITGEVKDRDGNVVLTAEEFEKGLMNGRGETIAGRAARFGVKAAGFAAKGLGAYFGFTYGMIWKGVKKVAEIAVDQFTQFDAYFPGDEEPRIRSKLMKKGYYRDKDGAPILSLKDIKGPVFDIEGNEIISQEEIDKYKSFYSRNGSLLFTIGRGFAKVGLEATKLGVKAALAYGKFVGKVYKGMWRAVKGVGRGIGTMVNRLRGKGLKGQVGVLEAEMAEAAFEVSVEQLKVQTNIYELLKKRFDPEDVHGDVDGDGVREYSWQDILRRRKEKAAAADANAGTGGPNSDIVDAVEKMNKDMNKKLDNLAEVTEEAGENSMLENAADLADITGGGGGKEGKGKGRPKRGFRSGRGIRGNIGRAAGWVGRGLAGAGRFALGAVTSPLGWLGRGAVAAAPLLASGAAAAGGAIATGAAAVGSAALTAGTAVVGALGAPLIIGAAVVGGAAYLGYRYYKSSQAKKFPLLYLRMTQYGVAPTDKDRVEKMMQLEKLCTKGVTIGGDGQASLDPERIDINAFVQLFSVKNTKDQQQLMQWLQNRFRPVYLAHCLAMQKIRNTTELSSADSGIGDGDLDTFLTTVDLPNMQDVYNDTDTSPFDSDLDTDADDVADAIKMVRDRREVKKKDADRQLAVAAAAGSAAGVKAATTLSVGKDGTAPSEIAKGVKVSAPMMGGGGAYQQRAAMMAAKQLKNLDIPTAVRFKTYGLKEFKLDKCEQLQRVEEVYWDHVEYSGTDKALITGNTDELKAKVFDIFKPADDVQRADVDRWITYRFMPAFLQYAISSRRRYNGNAKDAARNLTGPLMKEVLNEVTAAQTETLFSSKSVWTIANSPWPGVELETMSGSTKLYIDALDTGDSSKVLDVPGLEAQKRTEGKNAEFGNRMTNVALGNTTGAGGQGNIGRTGPTLANYGKIYGSGAVAGGVQGQSTTGQGDGSLLMTGPMGTAVQHPGGGTGGDINSIPEPTSKDKAAMIAIITAAAKMVGFDPKIAVNVAATESGLNPDADNGMAAGLFQFIGDTWRGCLRKYGAIYGISPNADRKDPRANAILGVCYLKENYEGLKTALGKEVTDLDLYMSHFLGLGGAKRFLSAPPGDPAWKHVGNGSDKMSYAKGDGGNIVLKPNASIFYKDYKSGNPTQHRTVQEVLIEMNKRMGIGLKKAGMPAAPAPEDAAASAAGSGGSATPSSASEDPNAMVAAGAASAAAAAAGGSAGTPSATPATAPTSVASAAAPGAGTTGVMPVSVAQEINKPADGGGGTFQEQLAPSAGFVPPPTATQAAAEQSQQRGAAEAAANAASLSSIMQKMYEVDLDSNQQLKNILARLNNMEGVGGGGAQQQPVQSQQPKQQVVKAPEPQARHPLSVKRGKAAV
jgi:hypothetical protein